MSDWLKNVTLGLNTTLHTARINGYNVHEVHMDLNEKRGALIVFFSSHASTNVKITKVVLERRADILKSMTSFPVLILRFYEGSMVETL